MDPVNVAAPRLPYDTDISHIVEVSLSIIDFLQKKSGSSSQAVASIKHLRPGLTIPTAISRAIILCTPLSCLEGVGLLNACEPKLPTVDHVLASLRKRLVEDPLQFWMNPELGHYLHDCVWAAYFSHDWDRIAQAPVAVSTPCDDVMLDALAELLLRLPDVTSETFRQSATECPSSPPATSLFSRLTPRKQGRRPREIRIEYGPPQARKALFYQPRRLRSLREDYDYLVGAVRQYDDDFTLSLAEVENAVLSQMPARRKPSRRARQ